MEEKKYSGVLILAETEHGKVHRVASVSYTHLDVYKRQSMDCCLTVSLNCLLSFCLWRWASISAEH